MSQADWKRTILKGYRSFRNGAYKTYKQKYEKLGEQGQNPDVLLISCADSRANPSQIFDNAPGDMFVVRNIANLVPPHEIQEGYRGISSALEYAVNILKVKAILVKGHENCGGIEAFIKGLADGRDNSFVSQWIHLLDEAEVRPYESVLGKDCLHTQLELAGVRMSLRNLMTYPFISEAVTDGRLELMGLYFSISQGKLFVADQNGDFHEMED